MHVGLNKIQRAGTNARTSYPIRVHYTVCFNMAPIAHLVCIVIMGSLFSAFSFHAMAADTLRAMSDMPGVSYRASLPAPTADENDLAQRLKRHVVAIASHEHNVAHYNRLEQAAQYLEKALGDYGYQVRQQEFMAAGRKVRNLEVSLKPEKSGGVRPELVVIGAHYDSAIDAPGANDNGSGTAAVVELAGLLKDIPLPDSREIRLVLYVNEEMPYFGTSAMGSMVHARDLHARGEDVAAMLSLETIGYYSDEKGSQKYPLMLASAYPDKGNFIGFVSDPGAIALLHQAVASFRRHAAFPSEGLAAPADTPGVEWSDHWSYRQFGYPAIMVTDTALYRYPYYHTAQDTPDKIDFVRLARVVKGLEQVIGDLVNP